MESPTAIGDRLESIVSAWEELAPEVSFGKMTLAQFKAKVAPSMTVRGEIKLLDEKRKTLENTRDDADTISDKEANKVVKGISGDPDYGTDSTLWEKIGYIRDSEKKSGLTRKKTPPQT